MLDECQRRYLRKLRISIGTQKFVAGELDITEAHLRAIEGGKSTPGTKLLFKMANYFNASVYELFPDLNKPTFYGSQEN